MLSERGGPLGGGGVAFGGFRRDTQHLIDGPERPNDVCSEPYGAQEIVMT